jgi:hypothetical protein
MYKDHINMFDYSQMISEGKLDAVYLDQDPQKFTSCYLLFFFHKKNKWTIKDLLESLLSLVFWNNDNNLKKLSTVG